MILADAAQNSRNAVLMSDTVFFWVQVVMIVGIVLALVGTFFLARSNKRMGEETQRRREQKRAEADTAEANIDALAGRPEVPSPDGPDGTRTDKPDRQVSNTSID